ncbi:Aste57867_4041 [Aphanomyces stellatus]|uniref:Aste57867_4041 protein n=1 Tax=Aphanomyces stellatus TaxID=120398 RepID=A0A485KAW1_9STRA|nr:hypothetical protein As57867_004030 [Aphanomyces stellatus]VFT81176.1 Aste57867_4041 [Aphanomyces stellatus]
MATKVDVAPAEPTPPVRRKSSLNREPSRRTSTAIADLVNNAHVTIMAAPATRQRRAATKDTWRRRLRHIAKYPHRSRLGHVYLVTMLAAIVGNFVPMMLETMDGPSNGGSDPAYPFLPSADTFDTVEVAFTAFFTANLALKGVIAKRQCKFWTQFVTWMDLLAVLPFYASVGMQYGLGWTFATRKHVQGYLKLLRLFRIVRVTHLLHNIDGMKILRITFLECLPPLQITLFFLVTIVMVFATLLFYAEPCYNAQMCPFTDVFNAGYFVMATVSTVGYGDQVPSTDNVLAIAITTAVMIFGSLYLSMPLAIIGIKYELNWLCYLQSSKTTSRSIRDLHVKLRSTTTSEPLNRYAHRVTLSYFRLASDALHLHRLAHDYTILTTTTSTLDDIFAGDHNLSLETLYWASQTLVSRYEDVMKHVQVFKPRDSTAHPNKARRKSSLVTLAGNLLSTAKRVLQGGTTQVQDTHPPIATNLPLRKRLRQVLHTAHGHHASWLNRFFLVNVILSLLVFYAETTPELQAYGPQSYLCLDAMKTYCASAMVETDPGCFVWASVNTTLSPPTKVQFDCVVELTPSTMTTPSSLCFGRGFNVGSNASSVSCTSSFASPDKICNLRQCQRGHTPLVDMTTHWLYFEAYFGVVFTLEFALRLYAARHRRGFLRSPSTWVDIAALFPYYVEGIAAAATTVAMVYAIVPTFPTFLSILPMMKSFRVFKLGRHFKSSSVLAQTAVLTFHRLMLPLFFLFLAVVTTGAIFYEIERGVECLAHLACPWLGFDVMTKTLAAPFPPRKRILIQSDKLALVTDMWRSTWLSMETITTVGYGDMKPRTPFGRLVDILTMIFGSCYTAMPLSLVGGQFYACYDQFSRQEKNGMENDEDDEGDNGDDDADDAATVRETGGMGAPVTTVLSIDDCEILKKCSVVLPLVGEMMRNMHKINLLNPASPALLPACDMGDDSATRPNMYHRMSDGHLFGRRSMLQRIQIAPAGGGGVVSIRNSSLLASMSEKKKRFEDLRLRIQVASAHVVVRSRHRSCIVKAP